MKAICINRQHTTIAKQAGVVAGSWLAMISLSNYDRTPSEFGMLGVQEGDGYC